MPKTEQHAYPFNHHLHKAEAALNKFFNSALSPEEQVTAAEELLIAANRLHISVTDIKNGVTNGN